MKPLATWLARVGIAVACLLLTGCGGGDVPDASSEGQAATDGGGAPAPAPAAAAPAEGEKVAAAEETVKTEEAAADPPAAAPSPAQAPAQEEETAAAPPKPAEGKGNSSTAEMLALATTPGSGGAEADPSAGSATPSPGSAPPAAGGPMMPGSATPGGAPGGMVPFRGGSPTMGPGGAGRGGMGMVGMTPPGGAGMPGGPAAMPSMPGMGPGNMPGGGPGGLGAGRGPGMGAPGGMAGIGGAGRNDGPADFHSPQGAVKAFLNALKAKDLDRLNEATALRAQVEAGSSKSQELFKKIFDLSLSDSELDKLAEQLDGYTVSGENPAKSTGRAEVILRKTGKNGTYYLRKVTVRHEKKGWGVLDIAGAMPFKPMGTIRRNTGSTTNSGNR